MPQVTAPSSKLSPTDWLVQGGKNDNSNLRYLRLKILQIIASDLLKKKKNALKRSQANLQYSNITKATLTCLF